MLSEWVIWSPKVWSTQVVLKYNLEADKGRDLNSPIWEDVFSGGTCCPLTCTIPGDESTYSDLRLASASNRAREIAVSRNYTVYACFRDIVLIDFI